jgi:hypothetical protein
LEDIGKNGEGGVVVCARPAISPSYNEECNLDVGRFERYSSSSLSSSLA